MSCRPTRSGFSLIEALVVLAISGMALAIIFSIGIKAGDTGFGLGRRAMSAADSDVAVSDLRVLIRSLVMRPSDAFIIGLDRPFVGEPRRLEGGAVMERATQCAPQGWAGRASLEIESDGKEQRLVCNAGGRSATLATLPSGGLSFAYSTDGQSWSTNYTNAPAGRIDMANLRSQTVWVRITGGPVFDVVESATSGWPIAWVRPDADF